ncbi:hypothetical protein NFI96_002015 [Prochilodus magdalenae]|nr:hypothetical protein NFI96_002015 [Prochilodus magdalenae]
MEEIFITTYTVYSRTQTPENGLYWLAVLAGFVQLSEGGKTKSYQPSKWSFKRRWTATVKDRRPARAPGPEEEVQAALVASLGHLDRATQTLSSLECPVMTGMSPLSPYLNVDPRYLTQDADEFILPTGANKTRGRFELAFFTIGSCCMTGALFGAVNGLRMGLSETKTMGWSKPRNVQYQHWPLFGQSLSS